MCITPMLGTALRCALLRFDRHRRSDGGCPEGVDVVRAALDLDPVGLRHLGKVFDALAVLLKEGLGRSSPGA
jgi:hypothetical protein